MNHKAILISGPVGKTLARLSLQMLIGSFSVVAYNLTDTYFVSRLGTKALAAISFTFPVVLMLGSLAIGLGIGAATVISQAIGAGESDRVGRLTTDSLLLSVTVALPVVIIGLLTMEPLFSIMGAGPALLPDIQSYMSIWYMGAVLFVVPMVGNNAIRASGDTLLPSAIMAFGALANIVLDPILIFGLGWIPAMGIAGAALATVIGRGSTLFLSLYILHFRKRMLSTSRPKSREILQSWKNILHVGAPAAGIHLLNPISMGIFTRLVARFGHAAVAAVGAGTRIEGFVVMAVVALASVLVPFIGQNWGAGRRDRAALGMRRSAQFSVAWGIICMVGLALLSEPLARVFSDDISVITQLKLFLWIVPLGYGLFGVSMLAGSAFNAIRKPGRSVALNLIRLLGLFLPLAFIGSEIFGFNGLLAGVAVANLAAGLFSWTWISSAMKSSQAEAQAQVSFSTPDIIA